MSQDIDNPPLYNAISERSGLLTVSWNLYFSNFIQTVQEYLGSNGIRFPQLTQDQIDNIKSPTYGQTIYNITAGTAQYWKKGSPDSWVSF